MHSRFENAKSGNPRGRRPKNCRRCGSKGLHEPVVITIDGERREITKREAVTRLVDKSAGADLRTTRMPIDMLKHAEKKAGVTPPPEPAPFTGRTK